MTNQSQQTESAEIAGRSLAEVSSHDRLIGLARSLDQVGARVRSLLLLRAWCRLLACVVASVIVLSLLDRWLGLPGGARGVLLLMGIGMLVVGVRRWVEPAARFRIGRSAVAHRLEQLDPTLTGLLAPSVDLLSEADRDDETGRLARAGIARASDAIGRVRPGTLVRWSGIAPAGSLASLSVVVVLLLAMLAPSLTSIAARRVLTPWTDARWPTRFGITDRTELAIHPADEALPIRVEVGPGDPRSRVRLEWRIGSGAIQSAPMTPQPTPGQVHRAYERLIAPPASTNDQRDARARTSDPDRVLRYRVTTPDDRSPWQAVRLVRPPVIVEASAEISPPAHAIDAPGLASFRTGAAPMSTGASTIGPVLGGSRVLVRWVFSNEVQPLQPEAWSTQAITVDQPDPRTIEVTLEPDAPTRIEPRVQDTHGLGLRTPVSASIDVRPDATPSVLITEPSSDQVVTPQAMVPVHVESADEVGVQRLTLRGSVWSLPPDSPGAPPEPRAEPATLAESPSDQTLTRTELVTEVSPATLGAVAGDEIVLVGVARDTRGEPGIVRSRERRLRVVSPEDFADRIRAQLDPVSSLLRRSDDAQRSLIERTAAPDADTTRLVREQIALGDTVDAARRAIADLEQAARINQLNDPTLRGLLDDLERTLGEAVEASRQAARLAEDREAAGSAREQQRVRERLGEAMSMLDRGSDAYLARRAIARLQEQLESAQRATGQIGAETAGKQAEELTPEQRAELDQLAESQRELADRAREALEELGRRAEALERDDPAQAEALRRAAESGRASAVASTIEQGAQQTGENQTGQAQQSQQQAIEQLEEMLEQIDSAGGLRDTALRRKLADLIASITALIVAQQEALDALDRAMQGDNSNPLDRGMIALRDNTLGVIEDASAALSELRLIAEALRDAESAQTQAIVALRDAPPRLGEALPLEQRSLGLLEQALEEAQRQDDQAQQREQDRKKAELRRVYRDALQEQSALRDDALDLVGRRLGRRERIEARRLAVAQGDLADRLALARTETEELSEAPVFELAHEQLDLLMRSAGDGLGSPEPPAGITVDQEQAIALLASLISVLGDDAPSGEQDFQDGSGGQGGGQGAGGGEQPLIPPVAELRLLRDMQQAAMRMTRMLGEQPALRTEPERLARLGRLQRALADRGSDLIERMSNQNQPAPIEPRPAQPDPAGPDSAQPTPETADPIQPEPRTESTEEHTPADGSATGAPR